MKIPSGYKIIKSMGQYGGIAKQFALADAKGYRRLGWNARIVKSPIKGYFVAIRKK
jgi:hypothetical protein